MTFCDFAPIGNSNAPLWQCTQCGFRTHKGLKRAPSRVCKTPIPVSDTPQSMRYLACPHRGRVLATISGRVAGCGCSSTAVEVYHCNHFNEPVTAKGKPRCLDSLREKVPGSNGRVCRDCLVPMQSISSLPIVHITHRTGWQDILQRSQATGAQYHFVEIPITEKDHLQKAINLRPAAIINHAFFEDADTFLVTARKHKNIAFAGVNHCSLNHAYRWPHYYTAIRKWLNAMEEIENVWYGGPDQFSSFEKFRPSIQERIVWYPNPVLIPPEASTNIPDPPTVVLACRDDWIMKCVPAQMVGMALAKQRRPEIQLQISLRFANKVIPHMQALTNCCRTKFEWFEFLEPNDWYKKLANEASVVMQATDHESFGYVAIDAMGHGRPVVTGSSVKFAPRDWWVDTEAPEQIADKILWHLDHYEESSKLARETAEKTAEYQNTAHRNLLQRITHV